jgi:uncharacterized protein (TIGR00645 family)
MREVERRLEAVLFGARWLAAPIYLGLTVALVVLLVVFVQELVHALSHMFGMGADDAVLTALRFVDIALVANLILIVILAGYENFVSRIDTADHEDRPAWIRTIGFADLKLKLFTSIVAITGIELLKAFMAARGPRPPDPNVLMWLVVVHMTFVLTTLLSAATDWLHCRAKPGTRAEEQGRTAAVPPR